MGKETDEYMSIDKLKIDSKKMGKSRDIKVFIGIRDEKE